jgi:hypothetical protein
MWKLYKTGVRFPPPPLACSGHNSMKIIERSVEISQSLFPQAYEERNGYRTYHFAFGWYRNTLVAIGQNRPNVPSSRALKFAKKFNTTKIIKYPFLHAEVDLISRLWGRFYIDNRLKVVIIRLNKFKQLQNSKPCTNCSSILNALGVNKLWWSTKNGKIEGSHSC